MKNKVVIIGCGNVGMAYAFAILNQKTAIHELILIDLDEKRVEGEVMDLNHCLAFSPSKIDIKCGTYEDCRDADIIMIAAGTNQAPGETRMDLINNNSEIFKSIIEKVMNSGFKGIFLIATNPLDVMTYLTHKYSKLDASKVIGSGTSLDTARLKYIVSSRLNINPKDISAYVVGEHGDSEFALYSAANIGGQKLTDFIDEKDFSEICHEVRNAAYEIINRKGATYYGIGECLVYITNAILNNENAIITVSTYDKENDVFIGLPAIINRDGVKETIKMNFNDKEQKQFKNSIDVIKAAISNIEM